MPRNVQEILDHADELAGRFEDYEPAADQERDPRTYASLTDATLPGSDGVAETADDS